MDSYPLLGVQKKDDDKNHAPSNANDSAIYQLWKQVFGDTKFISEFNQAWNWSEFELGDELTQYNCARGSAVSGGDVYLICKGKVRLLVFDKSLKKEVSIQLLHANQIFGGDNAFCNRYEEYRAVASSNGVIAKISLQHLDIWLQRYPTLSDYLSEITKSRQKLIFFKTLTELGSAKLALPQTSPILQKLLPHFLSTEISAGLPLITAFPSQGHFWLVSGEISSISGKYQPPKVGESWASESAIHSDFISRTDLSLFYLPEENFDLVAQILPELRSQEKTGNEIYEKHNSVDSENFQQEAKDTDYHAQYPQFDKQHSNRRWCWTYPFIQQQSSSDCAAASLAMISRYWGKRFSLNSLRSIAHINSMGAELIDLANAAQSLGYQSLPVRASLNQLESQSLPFIAHYSGNHYIVVWQIKDKRVFISDPAIGKKWLSRWEFEANFTEYALLLYPTELFYNKKSEAISFSRFYQFFRSNRFLLAKIIIISILLPLLGVAPALLTQNAIDAVITAKKLDSLDILALGFLVSGLGRITLTAVRQNFLDYLSNRLDINLIGDFINHTLELPLSFFASRRVADILSQIQENPKIHRFFTRQAISTILDGLMTVIYFGLMAYYSWQLTFVVMGFILAMMGLSALASLFLKKLRREYSFDSATQNSTMVEMITGVVTIKIAAAESFLWRHWQERFKQMVKTRQKGQNLTNGLQFASSLINHLGNTSVLWYGTHMVINSQISIGEFVAFNMLMGNTINPILALVKLWDEFLEIQVSVERLGDILTTSSVEKPQKTLIELPAIRGDLHFENVSFRYDSSQQHHILKNISFHIKPGQIIGIVGASGCGKSTLIKLLGGLYHPCSGRILIDGHDITQVSPYSLRSQLGIVMQEFFLFSGNILENITLYNREFSIEQIQAAAKLAGAHDFIQKLPLGYSTRIGERGIRLEKWQEQKIAIARSLIKNPRILLLDESSSYGDSQSEYQFEQNLARFNSAFINTSSTFRTTFIVTPSFNSILSADCILVLDRGVLADQGTHEELNKKNTVYPS